MSDLNLIEEVKAGNAKAVEALIESGADVNQQGEQGWTPLNFAAGRGDVELIKLLVKKGADVFKTGRDLRTPYMIAIAAGHIDAAKSLREIEDSSSAEPRARTAREYCKAYYLGELRKFNGWSEDRNNRKVNADGTDSPDGYDDETIVYLHQDFTVTESMRQNERVIFNDVTPEWEEFCRSSLQFKIPDDFDLMAAAGSAGRNQL
jgi:hypothetical protein